MSEVAVKAAEVVVTGMTRAELLCTVAAVLAILALAIYLLNFVLNLKLSGLFEMKEDVKVIRSKVKSGAELEAIAREQVHLHEQKYHTKGM